MALRRASLNAQEPLTNADRTPAFPFLVYMRGLGQDVQSAPSGFELTQATGQSASIATASLPTDGDLSAGLYRVTVYQRITTADAVSVSLQATLGWTDGGVSCTFAGTALTVNATNTVASFTFTMRVDAASPITYATTWSAGSGNGRYRIDVFLERLAAE